MFKTITAPFLLVALVFYTLVTRQLAPVLNRVPCYRVSDVALVGGGSYPQPGEISLAHNGVLFLDELPEFKRTVLEVMRQPMEERRVTISRSKFSITYPSNFMLVASMNPCACVTLLENDGNGQKASLFSQN